MADKGAFTHKLRVLGWQLLVGFILGVAFWEVLGQWILEKKYGSFGSSVTCAPDVKRALADFNSGLRISALAGAGILVVAIFVFKLWLKKRAPTPSGAPPASPPPSGGPSPTP